MLMLRCPLKSLSPEVPLLLWPSKYLFPSYLGQLEGK